MATETELERMIVRLIGDGSSYSRMMQTATKETQQAAQKISEQTNQIESMTGKVNGFASTVKSYGGVLLGLAGISGAFETLKSSISLAAEAEKTEVAFEVMLKSAEKGKEMVKQLTAFAAATPLNQRDVEASAKQLLQYGIAGNDIIPTLRMIGDIAGGDAQKIQQLGRAFGQSFSLGRLQGDEMNQMIEAGYNPMADLVAITGKSEQQLLKMREAGQISRDMIVAAFKHATAEGGQFHKQMEKQSKTLSGLFSTMQDDVSASLREIGKDLIDNLSLKEFIQEISKGAQMFTNWFKEIDPATKAAGAAVFGVVAAFGALTVAIVLAGKVLNIAFGGIPLLTGLIITGIAALVGYVSYLVVKNKGLAASWDTVKNAAAQAWDWTKRKAQQLWDWLKPTFNYLKDVARDAWAYVSQKAVEGWNWIQTKGQELFDYLYAQYTAFIDWVTPIWRAYVSFIVTYWGRIRDAAQVAWDGIVKGATWLWNQVVDIFNELRDATLDIIRAIAGDSELSWDKIRDYILEAFIAGEFAMNNFNAILDFLWVGAIYQVEKFKNQFIFVFTDLIPAAMRFFAENSRDIFVNVYDFITTIFTNLASNVKQLIKAIPKLIKGEMSVADLGFQMGKDLLKGFEWKGAKFEMPTRQIGDIERILKEEFEQRGKALGLSYEEFKRQRMEEFKRAGVVTEEEVVGEDAKEKLEQPAIDLGGSIAKAVTGGAKAELNKFDAVLTGSAEAVSRANAFYEKMKEQINTPTVGGTPSTTGPIKFDAVNANSAEAAARSKDPNTKILGDIRDTLKDQARSASKVELQPANLNDS